MDTARTSPRSPAGQSIAGAPDSTGLAPGATIVDLRVLDENGVGFLGDVLAAIDWAIANRKTYNIRVLNLSLSTPAAGSFLGDPLCRAVRAATSLGIVVVVAAGNSGQTVDGREVLGAMGSPAIEPSVITVGSANPHDTVSRGDETLSKISSRGPTRSGVIDQAGNRRYDNLLKPDLIAPGNTVVGALAGNGNTPSVIAAENPQLEVTGFNAGSQWPSYEAVRHVHRVTGGCRDGRADAAGEPGTDAEPGQSDSPIHGAAFAEPRRSFSKALACSMSTARCASRSRCARDIANLEGWRPPSRHRRVAAVVTVERQRRHGEMERHHHRRRCPRRGRQRPPREVPRHLRHELRVGPALDHADHPGYFRGQQRTSTGVRPALCHQDEGAVAGRQGAGRGRGKNECRAPHGRLVRAGFLARLGGAKPIHNAFPRHDLGRRHDPGRWHDFGRRDDLADMLRADEG